MKYEELLKEVGDRMGLAEVLRPNDDGVVTLSDGAFTLVISADPDRTRLEVAGEVGPLPEGGREGCLMLLMGANCRFAGTKGATLSVLPDDDLVLLNRRERLEGLDAETLQTLLQDFIDSLAEWRGILADYGRLGPSIDEARAADARIGGGAFLQI